MFLVKEDLDEVSKIIRNIFGTQGNIDLDAKHKNVVIWTKTHGKLWYGDVSTTEQLKDMCLALSKKLSKDVIVSSTDIGSESQKLVFSPL